MSIWDYLIPQTMEHQRGLARQRFGAAIQQPEMFQMQNSAIPVTPQLRQDYERGYGVPYPMQQQPSPTGPVEGMTFDPNRGTTIQPPTNIEMEYIPPRTLEEGMMRSAGMQGRAGMEKNISGFEYAGDQMPRIQSFFEDAGENIEDYDIPSSMGGFQRYEPATPGESQPQYGEKVWDSRVRAYVQSAPGEPDKWSPKASTDGSGTGKDQAEMEFKQHLDSYKAITGKVGRIDPALAMMMGQMGSEFFASPDNVQRLQGILTPMEQKIIQMNLQYLEGHFSTQTGNNDPMGIR